MGRIIAALAIVIGAAIPTPVAAADPMLGGRISPAPLVWERDPHVVNVTNLSTIPVRVSLTSEGGWSVDRAPFVLAVGERRSVPVTDAGDRDGTISAHLAPVDALDGADTVGFVLVTGARHVTLLERYWWPWVPLLLVAVALTAFLAIRRREARR